MQSYIFFHELTFAFTSTVLLIKVASVPARSDLADISTLEMVQIVSGKCFQGSQLLKIKKYQICI